MMKPIEFNFAAPANPFWVLHKEGLVIANALKVFEGQEVIVTARPAAKKRSNPQNAYYWGVCVKMIREHLLKRAAMDDDCRAEFSDEMTHQIIKLATGVSHWIYPAPPCEALMVEGRTKNKSVKEFQDYIMSVQEWAAKVLGLVIPDPVEPGYDDWLQEMLAKEAIE